MTLVLVLQAARLCTVRQAKVQLFVVLTLVLLYNIPRFGEGYLASIAVNTTDGGLTYHIQAAYTWLGDNEMYRIVYYNILYAVLMLAVPLVALTGLNVRLIRALTALRRKRAEMQVKLARAIETKLKRFHETKRSCPVVVSEKQEQRERWKLSKHRERFCGGSGHHYGKSLRLYMQNPAI